MDNIYRLRMESESSVGDEFDGMEPMSFDDLFIRYTNLNQETNNHDSDSSPMEDPKVTLFSVAMSLRRKEKGCNVMPLELRLLEQTIGIMCGSCYIRSVLHQSISYKYVNQF
jgi:hypothetical protein